MKKDLNWAVLGTGVIAKVYDSIDEVFVDDALREESKKPLERMLELAK